MGRRARKMAPDAAALPTGLETGQRSPAKVNKPVIDKQQVNLVLLGTSLVLIIALAGGTYLLHNASMKRTASVFLERAIQAEKEGKPAQAIKALTEYLRLREEDVTNFDENRDTDDNQDTKVITDVMLRLGRLLREGKPTPQDLMRAAKTYELVLRHDVGNDKVRSEAVEVFMKIGRYRDALDHIKILIKPGTSSTDPQTISDRAKLLAQWGDCQAALGEYREAQRAYAASIAANPHSAEPYKKLARIVSTRPNDFCRRSEIIKEIKELDALGKLNGPAGEALANLFPDESVSPESAIHTAHGIHQMAIQHVSPSWLAWFNAADFLAGLFVSENRLPLDSRVAAQRSQDLFHKLDGNRDGKLSFSEASSAEVPPCADRNFDGLVDELDELQPHLQSGDQASRLSDSKWALDKALPLVPNDSQAAKALVLMLQIDVNSALANQSALERPKVSQQRTGEAQRYLATARELAKQGLKNQIARPSFLIRLASVERQSGELAPTAAEKTAHQAEAEKLLREAAKLVKSSAEAPNPLSIEDQDLLQDKQVYELDVLWNLADTLSDRMNSTSDQKAADQIREEIRGQVVLSRMRELDAQSVLTALVDIRLLLAERKWLEANQKLTSIQVNLPANSPIVRHANVLRVFCAEKMGNADVQLDLARAIVADNPLWPPGRITLAEALVDVGRLQEASNEFSTVVGVKGVPERLIATLLQLELSRPYDQRNWPRTEAALKGPSGKSLSQEETYRNWERIETALEELENQPDSGPQFTLSQSDVLFAKAFTAHQRFQATADAESEKQALAFLKEIEEKLTKAVADAPSNTELRVGLVNFYIRRFDMSKADQFQNCQRVLADAPESSRTTRELTLAAISAGLLMPQNQAASWLLNIENDADKMSPADKFSVDVGLAEANLRFDDRDQALTLLQQASQAQPTTLRPVLLGLEILMAQLADQLEQQKKEVLNEQQVKASEVRAKEQARLFGEFVDRLGAIEGPDGPNASYYRGARDIILLSEGKHDPNRNEKLKSAKRLLEKAVQQRPAWTAPLRFLGEAHSQLGDNDAMVEEFKRAFRLGDRNDLVINRIVQHYYQIGNQTGNYDEADRFIKEATAASPQRSGPLSQLAWRVSYMRQDTDRAIELVRGITNAEPTSENLILLALLKFSNGESGSEVERLLKQACEKNPDSAQAWQSLVAYYCRTHKLTEAMQAIEDANGKLPKEPPSLKPMTLASCYEMVAAINPGAQNDLLAKAETSLKQAADVEPAKGTVVLANFYTRHNLLAKAQEIIAKLLDPSQKDVQEDVKNWARRSEQVLLAASGDPAAVEKALTWLQDPKNVKSPADRLANLRAEVAILGRHGESNDTNKIKMIQKLEKIRDLNHDQLPSHERYQLAVLYGSMNQFTKGEREYLAILKQDPKQRVVLASLAQMLIRQGADDPTKLDSASEYIETLRKLEPDSLRYYQLASRLQRARGNDDEAARLLMDFAHDRMREQNTAGDAPAPAANETAENLYKMLESVPNIRQNKDAMTRLERARKLIQVGEQEQAKTALFELAHDNQLSVNTRVESIRTVAYILHIMRRQKEAEELYRYYGANVRIPIMKLLLPQYLAEVGRNAEALQECDKLVDQLPIVDLGKVVVPLLRSVPNLPGSEASAWIERLQKAAKAATDPKHKRDLLILLGEIDVMRADYDGAIDVYSEILSLNPSDLVAMNNLAMLNARLGKNLSSAESLINSAIREHDELDNLVDTQIIILIAQRKYDSATALIEHASLKNPKDPLVDFRRAEVAFRSGRRSDAAAFLKTSIDKGLKQAALDPFDSAVYREISEAK